MDAEFWVLVGFVIFVMLAAYLGVHSKLGALLDARGARIRAELDEAERLRKEAAAVLASFEGKRAEAEREAAAIVEQARVEAEMIAKEAQERLADFVTRRTAQAEAKIATAETNAMAEVRAAAADAATAAAEIVLRSEAKGSLGDQLLTQGIGDVKRLAH
ncbi:ATP F0F1 synthase subunit B [Beijerinckia sp. L45]|uniref:F0F1 ATP synthase subunit B family protein n=1 Tax=Beijerinckia sp. L45 TaxID=1641855 RepID=UPI00131D5D32|nr:ATP F0F1 synthase subunit B [Beijerinckia sp. L45]